MGKSNQSKKVSSAVLRKYVKERTLWKWLSIASAALLVGCCMFAGPRMEKYGWMCAVSLGIYIVCMFTFRQKAHCPNCGKAIMQDFNKLTHCPYCKRPIKEKTGGKDARNLLNKR